MAEESFTRLEQIARDIKLGVFPAFSDDTEREMAIAKAVFDVAMEGLVAGAPGLSDAIRRGIARSIAMKVSALPQAAPTTEHQEYDTMLSTGVVPPSLKHRFNGSE